MPSRAPKCVVESDENFETGSTLGWTGFTNVNSAFEGLFTKFLGPFGNNPPEKPVKVVSVTPGSTRVRVMFSLYILGSWDPGGKTFDVDVNGLLLSLGPFSYDDVLHPIGDPLNTIVGSTTVTATSSITWTYTVFGKVTPGAYYTLSPVVSDVLWKVTIDIPGDLFLSSETVRLEFFTNVDEPMSSEAAGIDDMKVISCPQNLPFP